MVTHLFNAMSQIGNREPGLAGAAIDSGRAVRRADRRRHSMSIRRRSASRCAPSAGRRRIFLVTDAMATIGTDMTSFTLNGRIIHRKDGRLTLADGTLAGADLDMISAVRFMHRDDRPRPRRGAAHGLALSRRGGRPGASPRPHRQGPPASFVHLSDALEVRGVWIEGRNVHKQAE